ncbi:hypothetical protein GF367_03745 [Candidatus Woesearchaeota archaeon]|nr:hypothetical protein [Candidatus Woesearchaeota archaeon]
MINQRLIDYIKAEEAQGFSLGQLEQYLVDKGFPKQQIDEALHYAALNNLHPHLKPKTRPAQQPVQPPAPQQPSPQPAKPAVPVKKERPALVTVLAIIFLVGGVMHLTSGIYGIINPQVEVVGTVVDLSERLSTLETAMMIVSAWLVLMGALAIIAGVGLLKLKKFGRILAIILSIFMILSPLVIIGVALLILSLHKQVKAAFTA